MYRILSKKPRMFGGASLKMDVLNDKTASIVIYLFVAQTCASDVEVC